MSHNDRDICRSQRTLAKPDINTAACVRKINRAEPRQRPGFCERRGGRHSAASATGGGRYAAGNRPLAADNRRMTGFVLILVLVYIVLAASLLFTTTGSTTQLVRTTQRERVSILLRQLVDSASAWARQNRVERTFGDDVGGQTTKVTLDGTGLLPPDWQLPVGSGEPPVGTVSALVTISPATRAGELATTSGRGATTDSHQVRVIRIEAELDMRGRRYVRTVTVPVP